MRSQYLRLVGLDAPPVRAGESAAILTAWQVEAPLPAPDVWPILQVEDALATVLDRSEVELVQTDQWPVGATIFQEVPLSLPPGTPPGSYALRLAWVARQQDDYLPFLNRQGNPGIAFARIGGLPAIRPDSFPSPEVLPIGQPADVTVAPGVQFLGWSAQPERTVRPGDRVEATLFWQAVPAAGERAAITVEVLLVDAGGGERVLWQGAPVRDSYPSDRWADGELVADRARWRLPLDLLPGPYTLAARIGEHRFDLTLLGVAAVERVFDPPAVEVLQNMRLGDRLRLYGSTLVVDGRSPRAILVWQADAPIDEDYTVFVHVAGRARPDRRPDRPHAARQHLSDHAVGSRRIRDGRICLPGPAARHLPPAGRAVPPVGRRAAARHAAGRGDRRPGGLRVAGRGHDRIGVEGTEWVSGRHTESQAARISKKSFV